MTKEGNIEMTHEVHRELKNKLFGVKKFVVTGAVGCPYLGICKTIYKNKVYCKTLKYKKCIEYLVNKIRYINQKAKSENQGHLNNDGSGKCLINSINRNTKPKNEKDAGVKL